MDNSSLLFSILIAFGACQALFISIILLTQPDRTSAKRLFAIFLIIEGITLLERLSAVTGLDEQYPFIIGISYPISFIKPPLLLFMAHALVNRKYRLNRANFWHFIPFLLMLIINLPFYFQPDEVKLNMVHDFLAKKPSYSSFGFYLSFSFFIYIGIYIALTTSILLRFKQHVKNNKLINWYLKVLRLYIVFLSIHLIYFLIQPSGLVNIPQFHTISMLVMTFVIQAIAYSLIKNSQVFAPQTTPDIKELDKRNGIKELILEKLNNEKVYLDETLTLKDFSKSLSLPESYISELINQQFGCNFKQLIGGYRAKEAENLMRKNLNSTPKFIDIAYDAGFNNKVSFYRTFKQHYGKSPSEYFKELKKDVKI